MSSTAVLPPQKICDLLDRQVPDVSRARHPGPAALLQPAGEVERLDPGRNWKIQHQ